MAHTRQLHLMAESTGCGITHCYADVLDRSDNTSLQAAYSLKGGHNDVEGDAVLSVVPGSPLMPTENINLPLGNIPFPSKANFSRSRQQHNC
jgi:hypothetical protein